MAVHHGGKVGAEEKTLAKQSSSQSAKSKAGATLANHKAQNHSKENMILKNAPNVRKFNEGSIFTLFNNEDSLTRNLKSEFEYPQ